MSQFIEAVRSLQRLYPMYPSVKITVAPDQYRTAAALLRETPHVFFDG